MLFNASARVYNLRLLLLGAIFVVVLSFPKLSPNTHYPGDSSSSWLAVSCSCVIIVHHIIVLFMCPMRGLAAVDLTMVALEIGVECYGAYLYLINLLWPLNAPLLLALVASAAFRIATVAKTENKLFSQRFEFLGCCKKTTPRYTPLSILLNRSLARPLVRGESRPIIFLRAVILNCVILGVPAVGVYAIIILPLRSRIYARSYLNEPVWFEPPPGNVTIAIGAGGAFGPSTRANVQAYGWDQLEGYDCPLATIQIEGPPYCKGCYPLQLACPLVWPETSKVVISITFPQSDAVYVWALQGVTAAQLEENLFSYFDPLGTLLLPGSRLFGVLSWTRKDVITGVGPFTSFTSPSVPVFTAEITSLQPDPHHNASAETTISTLTLLQPVSFPTKFVEYAVGDTALSGVSIVGGLWTFLNGTFALIFGANVIYFAFGRRPLSALGVIHLFQRDALVRRWHEDFPSIHTEGGEPGSESAGIVAFIRERLVDLGEDPRALGDELHAIETQHSSPGSHMPSLDLARDVPLPQGRKSEEPQLDLRSSSPRPEYRLDQIPMLDMDLSLVVALKDQ